MRECPKAVHPQGPTWRMSADGVRWSVLSIHPVAGRDPAAAAPAGTSAAAGLRRREGTRNLFLACEPLAGWRPVTERRTMQDFAQQMRWLVDEAYPEAEVVRVVLDNLNTSPGILYETFPAEEARRIARRLEFHYTPKHGSWLNMACPGGGRGRRSSSAYCPAPA